MTTPPVPPRPGPTDRQHIKHLQWRERVARQLGTTSPLAGVTADSLERAIPALHRSLHPDAWIAATLCTAELERRRRQPTQAAPTHHTAAEHAWAEAQARRAAA